MNDAVIITAAVITALVLLPPYLLILSKFAQVGRMAGEQWFNCYRRKVNGGKDGTSSSTTQ